MASKTSVSKRRSQDAILADLEVADHNLRVLQKVAQCLPKKLYSKRKSHKRAAFIAKKTNRPLMSKNTQFTLKLMKANFIFNKLRDEYIDSQRNFTIKEAIADKA